MSDTVREADADLVALRSWIEQLSRRALQPVPSGSDRIARIRLFEDLRSAVAAAQAAEVAALSTESGAAVEVEIATVDRPGIGRRRRREQAHRRMVGQVQQARRISPWQASQFVAFAERARTDVPATFALMASGRLSERRAVSVFTAVSPLDPEQRRLVDAELASGLPGWGDRRVDQQARAAVYRVDPAGAVKRNAYAVSQRRVSVRPAPECMAWVTALTTMPVAVATRAQLLQDAKAAIAAGDTRMQGQLMADTLAGRVLNPAAAAVAATVDPTTWADTAATVGAFRLTAPAAAEFTGPVAIQLVMSDRTLLGGDEPARFADGTPYPAPLARDLALGDCDANTPAARSIRRLFADPAGRLVTGETNARNFTPAQRDLVRLRDGLCTTPWCDAPIEHIDHDNPHIRGGPTSLDNARGRCRWCNHTKGDRPPESVVPPEPVDPVVTRSCVPPRARRSPLERQARRRIHRAVRRVGRGTAIDFASTCART